ncbi:MAG: sigma factor-like helix-turn-helix DNA-binding protein [Acidimicrobiia bacterium]
MRWRRRRLFPPASGTGEPWVEPELPKALERLTPLQRQAVVLVHGCGYPYREVAQLLEISENGQDAGSPRQ